MEAPLERGYARWPGLMSIIVFGVGFGAGMVALPAAMGFRVRKPGGLLDLLSVEPTTVRFSYRPPFGPQYGDTLGTSGLSQTGWQAGSALL